MILPNFELDEGWKSLMDQMGVKEPLQFGGPDDFDWKKFTGFGIDIEDINEVEVADDGTLYYKGRRVLVYIRDQHIRGQMLNRYQADPGYSTYKYHVAECRTLQMMRENNRFGRYVLTGRVDGKFVVNQFIQGEDKPYRENHEIPLDVCKNCLHELNWDSYTSLRGTRKDQAVKDFNPEKYLEKYGSKVRTLPVHDERTARLNQYPDDWTEISRRVRKQRHYTCEGCSGYFGPDDPDDDGSEGGAPPMMAGNLHVHHKDGQKNNCAWSNLKVVCVDCHAQEFNHQHLIRDMEETD